MTQNRLDNYVIHSPNCCLTHIDLKLYTKCPPIMMCYYTHVRDDVGSWITIASVLEQGCFQSPTQITEIYHTLPA